MNKIVQHLDSNISYSVEGTGETLVLLHGLCEDKDIWSDFILPLLATTKIICIDLPGFGNSLPGNEHHSMELMAEAVLAILNKEQIEKCFLLGHSMGGYVTLSFAEKNSRRLKGIGLFHSSCFTDDDAKKKSRKKVAEFVLEKGSRIFTAHLFPTLFAFAENNKELISSLEEKAATIPKQSIANSSLAMATRKDLSKILKETTLPVLLIIGERDLVFPMERSMLMTPLPTTAIIYLLEQSAHMGIFEEPEKSIQAIKNWMSIAS